MPNKIKIITLISLITFNNFLFAVPNLEVSEKGIISVSTKKIISSLIKRNENTSYGFFIDELYEWENVLFYEQYSQYKHYCYSPLYRKAEKYFVNQITCFELSNSINGSSEWIGSSYQSVSLMKIRNVDFKSIIDNGESESWKIINSVVGTYNDKSKELRFDGLKAINVSYKSIFPDHVFTIHEEIDEELKIPLRIQLSNIRMKFSSNITTKLEIKNKVSSYIHENGWNSYSSLSEGDIDGDGVKEIAILAQKKSDGITDTTALLLGIAKKGDKLIPLFENSKLIPKITPLGYYDDDIKIKNKALIAFYSRGTGSRTSVTNVFKYSAKTLILEKQTLLNTNSSESNITEYYPLDGKFVLTKERECYRDEKDCDNFKEEKTTEKIAYKKITFEEYCFSISKEIASRFDCLKQQYPTVNTKAYLHKDLNKPTKMYLIKGDKVTLLDEKTDDSTQKCYFINYKGTKDLNMWIKAEAVDIPDNKDIPKEEKAVLELEKVSKKPQPSTNSSNNLAVKKENIETPISKEESSITSTNQITATQEQKKNSAGGSMPLLLIASLLGVFTFKFS